MAFAQLKIISRSKSHAPFWLVADKSGVWERNDLAVNTSPQLIREKAAEALKIGHVDLISGNHHNLYVRNALGEDFVHLAQAANNWTENRFVAADRIGSVTNLKGKKVVVDKLTSHSGLNVWLYLRQEGLHSERGDIELVKWRGPTELSLKSDDEVEGLYQEWTQSLERKPYPSIQAIANVFQLALRRNPRLQASIHWQCGTLTTSANWTIAAI
jgi:ABC-type nitrate/sulfonate/bicarbonate transport system substrate-binding protein